MCELPGFSAISGLPGVAGLGLRSLEIMQSVSSINTETHTDTQTHTHMHLGGCGLGSGELGQEKGGDATNSFPSFGGRSRGGRRGLITATWGWGTCSVVLGRFASSLLPLKSYYCMEGRGGERRGGLLCQSHHTSGLLVPPCRCSSGFDRYRQEWLAYGCAQEVRG